MIQRFAVLGVLSSATLLLCQCTDKEPGPNLIGQNKADIVEGDALFKKGEAEEAKGDIGDAIKLYGKVAERYPSSNFAGEASYRHAKLLDQDGDKRKAFKAYDRFLKDFPSHPKHSEALEAVFTIAVGAQRGDVQTNFLGMKGKLPIKVTAEMLAAVMKHAPRSDMAAKANYAIGELYLQRNKHNLAVSAFRALPDNHPNHALAPEALFRVGKILLDDAESGNQNQANIDLSSEAFNDYLIQYPGHYRNAEARKMIASLKSRDVQRTIDVADFYYKTKQMESAKIYYRDVIKKAKSGPLHDRAKARLQELEN